MVNICTHQNPCVKCKSQPNTRRLPLSHGTYLVVQESLRQAPKLPPANGKEIKKMLFQLPLQSQIHWLNSSSRIRNCQLLQVFRRRKRMSVKEQKDSNHLLARKFLTLPPFNHHRLHLKKSALSHQLRPEANQANQVHHLDIPVLKQQLHQEHRQKRKQNERKGLRKARMSLFHHQTKSINRDKRTTRLQAQFK